ncbi:hypothetical protein [Kistimonas asteriae]|uniref:hypothetical protein n=1 Tax=Kistimonas asteriae TaxID=517724 RepID=UPI001BA8CEA9|nr:hypothetical protein [Kistimonas asteriae]
MTEVLDKLINIAKQISRGEIPEYQNNERFTSGAFDLLLVNAHGPEAFSLLSDLCSRVEALEDHPVDMKGIYLLASQLAVQSRTTEMPAGMERMILSNPSLSKELSQWYRFKG